MFVTSSLEPLGQFQLNLAQRILNNHWSYILMGFYPDVQIFGAMVFWEIE